MSGARVYKLGNWLVEPELHRISSDAGEKSLRPMVMELLDHLAQQDGRVVSADEILDALWPDRVVASGSVYNCISELRDALDDGDLQYVETIPKKGYRLTQASAAVASARKGSADVPGAESRRPLLLSVGALLAIIVVLVVTQWPQVEPPPRSVDPNAIVVLPFTWLGEPGADGNALAFALEDDLLTLLTRIDGLRVIARTTLSNIEGSDAKTLAAINAGKVVEGSVRRDNNRLRVNVRLIDTISGDYLWSQPYDRELSANNLFALQTDIVTSIATRMQLVLSQADIVRLSTVPTDNLAAWEAFELGKRRMYERNVEATEKAIAKFRQATELDPQYAAAYAALADAIGKYIDQADLFSDRAMIRQVEAAARTAVSLDPELSEAHVALGFALALRRDFDAAHKAFRKGISLSPGSVNAYHQYGISLVAVGRMEEALEQTENALALDPLSAPINMANGLALAFIGRFDEAIDRHHKAIEINPRFTEAYSQLCNVYYHGVGELDKAMLNCAKVLELDPGSVFAAVRIMDMFHDFGDPEQTRRWSREVIRLAPPQRQWVALAALDDRDGLIALIDEQLADPNRRLISERAAADHLFDRGRYDEARTVLEARFPEWFSNEPPDIVWRNDIDALRAAIAMEATGDADNAQRLFERILDYLSRGQRNGVQGYHFLDVRVLAHLGRTEEAIAAFRRAYQDKTRFRYSRFRDGFGVGVKALRDHPGFAAIAADFERDLGQQRQRVAELGKTGVLPLVLDDAHVRPR